MQFVMIMIFVLAAYHGHDTLASLNDLAIYFALTLLTAALLGVFYMKFYQQFMEMQIEEDMQGKKEPDDVGWE